MNPILQRAIQRWQLIAEINGDYIARVAVNVFYFTILVPFAYGVKLLLDPLALKDAKTHWLKRTPISAKLDDARNQF